MNVTEMTEYLTAHGVPEWMYTVGGLGGGEIDGIGHDENGNWITYYSERGARRGIQTWPSEEEAVADLVEKVRKLAQHQGVWCDLKSE